MGYDFPDKWYLFLSRYEDEALLDRHQFRVLDPAKAAI